MSKSTKEFKDMLHWQLFALRQSLKAIENLREHCPAHTSKEDYAEWLEEQEKEISTKEKCIVDTILAYKYTFHNSDDVPKIEEIDIQDCYVKTDEVIYE